MFDEYERDARNWLGLPSLWRIRRQALLEMVRGYVEWEQLKGLKGGWTPSEFEFAFGGDESPVSISGLTVGGTTAAMRVRGKIDRIDHLSDKKGQRQRVIDYKSGSTPSPSGYLDGGVLQGPLYLAVLAGLGRPVATAEYRSLKKPGSSAKVSWEDDDCNQALRLAFTIPVLVREGRFEPQAAKSTKWKNYWPGGLALYRCEVELEGSRFE